MADETNDYGYYELGHIVVDQVGRLWPSDDLYPRDDIYPDSGGTVGADLEIAYDLGGLSGADLAVPFDIAGAVGSDLDLVYNVAQLAGEDLDAPYEILGKVGADLALGWSIYLLPHFRRAPGTHLTWELCDLTGTRLAWIRQRTSASVEFALNEQAAGSVNISLEDREAVEVATLSRLLRVKMDGVPLFTGYIVTPKFNSESNSVEIRAFDPMWRLKEKAHVGMKAGWLPFENYRTRAYRFEGMEQEGIMWRLIRHAFPTEGEANAGVPHFGVQRGSVTRNSVKLRDREYEFGKSLGEALREMTEVIDGPDFEFRPLDESVYLADTSSASFNQPSRGWRHWDFNTYKPFMGTDRTVGTASSKRVMFEYGTGKDNCTAFSWEPDGLVVANRAIMQGQAIEGLAPAKTRSNQPNSQVTYGIYNHAEASSEIIYATTLKEHTDEYVAAHAYAPDFFTLTPSQADGSGFRRNPSTGQLERTESSYKQPFIFGPGGSALHDFWLGDIIQAVARFGAQPDGTWAVDKKLTGRVTDAKIEEAEGGAAHQTTITCAPQLVYAGVV